MSLIFKNDKFNIFPRSLARRFTHYVAFFQDFVDTPINGRPSFFRIDRLHHMETSLSHALLVY
jgi:hypothetical protein